MQAISPFLCRGWSKPDTSLPALSRLLEKDSRKVNCTAHVAQVMTVFELHWLNANLLPCFSIQELDQVIPLFLDILKLTSFPHKLFDIKY